MKPFLESLAAYIVHRGGDALGNTRIVLPNRRSGIFLQRHLSRYSADVSWMPEILSINEFISELSGMEEAAHLESVFALYDLYLPKVDTPEPLDEFYHWGVMMLTDFDEIDKYLVNADQLFSNVLDLKEIEEPLAGLDEDQIRFIRQFWEGFQEGGTSTAEKVKFLQIWELLPRLYHGLRERLQSTGTGYPGMLYRRVTELISSGMLDPLEGRTIVAGFNALNGSEAHIFSWLKEQGTEFFWDFDHTYLSDSDSEAGRFMRENITNFPPPRELEPFRGLESDKEIRIFELPSDVLQAKTVYRILEGTGRIPAESCTETALILCDEELLMPVITSLPGSVEELNVTMGYPMKNSPLYGFIDALLRLQHNARRSRNGTDQFYHKDVMTLLLHPYLRAGEGTVADGAVEAMNRSNMIFVERDLFSGCGLEPLFRNVESTPEMFDYFGDVLQYLLDHLVEDEPTVKHQLDREFIFQLMIQLNKLKILLLPREDVTPALFERLFRRILSGLRIPFEGEPLAGLQVMGILETRLLDFNHVVLLSMNEEVMPASHQPSSYIPYSLKRAFNMPAREDKDAIYAYYFYRLLQRATRIDLVYNSGSEGMRTGEMSRYLYQLIYAKGIEVIRPGMNIRAVAVPPLMITHDQSIASILEKFLEGVNSDKYLSPSAINTYMDCSLKFYLRYLAGIGEPDQVEEEIDPAGFGTVVHETVRIIYQEIADRNNGNIGRKDLEGLLEGDQTAAVLKDVFISTHFHGQRMARIEGRNLIAYRVMQRYLQKIIRTDLGIAPFRLVSAERTYLETISIPGDSQPMRIRVGGKIDRIDLTGDTLRVIDYKTGDVSMQFPSLGGLFDVNSGSRNGAAFQTLFYAWLVSRSHSGAQILPGLYAMRELYKSDFNPALVMGAHQTRTRVDSFTELEEEFVGLLQEIISRIFNPAEPFVQTENLGKCRVCDFAEICSRDQGQS